MQFKIPILFKPDKPSLITEAIVKVSNVKALYRGAGLLTILYFFIQIINPEGIEFE